MNLKRIASSFFTAALVTGIIFIVLNDFGITWDEPIYMRYADKYTSWIIKPVPSERDKVFMARDDDIHPPFRKLIAGITHQILTTDQGIIDNTRGYRISSLLFVFPFILLFTYIAIGRFGYGIGMLTPLMFSFLPHVLFLTPLVTLDYGITALWFVAVMSGVKGMKSYLWLVVSAVCIGLALLTKLYGYFLFVPVVGYWFFVYRKHLRSGIVKLLCIFGIAFAVYFIGWPWLWSSPAAHFAEYIRLQFLDRSIPAYIFGRIYTAAPWWYTPVMFFVTTPVFVLISFLVGSFWTIRKGKVWDRVILFNALFLIVFFSLPGVYRYDWIRLFLPAYPFMCLIAGRGIWVTVGLLRGRARVIGKAIIIVLWLYTVYASVIRIHPLESAYYNEVVGGTAGAARLGFESEFWGNSYMSLLPWMNYAKGNAMCTALVSHAMYYYKAMGQLKSDVIFNAERPECGYLIVLMRQGFLTDPFVLRTVKEEKPVYTVSLDGVTLVGVYDIRERKN